MAAGCSGTAEQWGAPQEQAVAPWHRALSKMPLDCGFTTGVCAPPPPGRMNFAFGIF